MRNQKNIFLTSIFVFISCFIFAQQSKIDSLQNLLKTSQEDTNKLKILDKLGEFLWRKGDNDLAMNLSNQAKELAIKLQGSSTDKIKYAANYGLACAYSNIATVEDIQGNYLEALKNEITALAIRKDIDDKGNISNSYINIGITYDEQGDYSEALENYFDALKAIQGESKKENEAIILGNIGNVYKEQGNYPDALKMFFKCLDIDQKMNSKDNMAISYQNIGECYNEQGNFSEAFKYYLLALNLYKQVVDKEGTANCYQCIGSSYTKQHNYSEAIKNDLASLQMQQEIGSKSGIATLYSTLGSLYMDENKYAIAFDNYTLALNLRKEIGDKEGIAHSYIDFGNLYIQQKQFPEAITALNNAKNIAQEIGEKNTLKACYEKISEAYYGEKKYEAAYDFHKLYADLKDTILNEQSQKQIAEMGIKYETEKKDKQIQLLNKDKAFNAIEIQKQKVETEKQQTERNAFIIGFILMIGLAFFIFKNYREKQKANEIITAQKIEVEHQKTIVEEKNKDITDSIYYARRIQRALLTSEKYLKKNLPDYFILYKPKDIVSGDFYWALNIENNFFIATADCTGHGVPGAFMSMLGINFLNEIVIEKKMLEPNKIMNELRQNIIHALNPEDTQEEAKDGMDMVLCAFDFKNKKLKLAAANNPVWIIRKNENETPFIEEIKSDKFPVGKHDQDTVSFTAHEISLNKGDIVYTFTDGYADQFGGPKGKKFKYKPLQELLLANCDKSMEEQQKIITETLVDWKGNLEQVDDILLIGIRV